MGKNLRHKVTCSPIQNHPGFMWGLFDILKHNHWRYIKKRLPHKRPVICRRNAPGTKNEVHNTIPSPDSIPVPKTKLEDKTDVDSGQRPKRPSSAVKSKESSNSGEKPKKKHNSEEKSKKLNSEEKSKKLNSEERSRKTHSEIKRSVKALIKALVIEDKSKKKGRHHRSCTYPVQSNPKEKESLSEVESSDKNSSNGDDRNRVFNKTAGISPAIGSLNPLYLMSEESSNSDSEDFRVENNIQVDDTDGSKSDFDEKEFKKKDKSDDDDAWFDPKMRYTKDFSENEDDTSPRRSKACLDALNLIHMNRNFLLKVLQDPGSPLARHFQSQQSFSSKTMTKAGSFPTHGTNREDHNNGFDSVGDIDKKPTSPSIAAEHRADGIQKMNETLLKLADEDSSGSGYARKRGKNQVVIKRFKDLRQKIKHVINENKNEKHRITMDAVLDKVPRKYGFSKDLRDDIFAHLKGNSAAKNNNKADGVKLKQITRASSLCGSLDRYLQLYECSFQRDAKNNSNSEKSKVESEESALPSKRAPKFLGRILSLPEMKFNALKIDDLPVQSIEEEQDGLDNISEISEEHSQSSEHETVLDQTMNASEDSPVDAETEQDREISTLFDAETKTRSLKESSEESPNNVSTVDIDENASVFDISRDLNTEIVSRSKQLDEVLNIDAQDKVKFNYVRDILEISGFNAPESLSMWQLDYQPLDPLVYEEVTTTTGCMFQDPECSRNEEEGGNCNHLLLFDLINEVLIEIYERSYHYCPKPLSSLCKIHPMPVGYSVLKEVWVRISCYLRYKPYDEQQSFDKIMSRDLSKDDGWMDLQFESECVGIEVEDLIFEELLEELLVSG
ncbi:hypothetical protein ISN45_Aa06g001510 [Arabidopsis thaliana x Arabidopsis arenosa]|uniref:Protein TRM32-like n=1 Tax=Arabidopsis thaliana x Arabidopsis arenosa TaxID=1240361 RepID=A0A8T1YSU0_9BRAS|nr:hypothetical protein ISN45_Aa06g001510 [Arabidopsis thaliana x Arabidopsis arenosa]